MSNQGSRDVLQDAVNPSDAFTLHQGDSLELSSILSHYFENESLQENLVNVTITSPPYADLKVNDYESNPDEQIGVEKDYEEYLDNLRDVYKQVYDVTKPEGTLWIVVNTFKSNGRTVQLPWDIADVCENLADISTCPSCESPVEKDRKQGDLVCNSCSDRFDPAGESWTLHDVIIWDKERARPYSSRDTFRNVFEYVLAFKKSDSPKLNLDKVRIADPSEFAHWWVDWPERYHPRGKVPENIWSMVTPTQGRWGELTLDHPAPFPPDLVERIISFTTEPGDVVFDPFGGTGMTLAQAKAMERNAVGVELSENYCRRFDQLCQEIEARWEKILNKGQTLQQQQRELARVIWGLRQLVYARKMFLSLRREFDANTAAELGASSIFVIANDSDPGTDPDREAVKTALIFAFEDPRLTEELREKFERYLSGLTGQSPWQGFGVEPSISVQSIAELSHKYTSEKVQWTDERLLLYNGSEHYRYQRSIEFGEWVNRASKPRDWRSNYASDTYPPTVSNIRVNINREGETPQIEADILDDPPEKLKDDVTDEIKTDPKVTRLDDF